jgi:hypothetical protein
MKLEAREAIWRERIGKWRRSGLSGPKFCARHGLYLKSFYRWRKRLDGERTQRVKQQDVGADLVPVQLMAACGEVRIEVGTAVVVVTEQSSPTALRTALQALDVLR